MPGKMRDADLAATARHVVRSIASASTSRSNINPAWRPRLSQPLSVYGFSCWTYSIAGILVLAQSLVCPTAFLPDWANVARKEGCALVLQGCWSFCSDVLNVGRPSRFHSIDRVSALMLTCIQIFKFGIIAPYAIRLDQLLWGWLSIVVGLSCKLMGSRAILADCVEDFYFWHCMWHLTLPVGLVAIPTAAWLGHDAC